MILSMENISKIYNGKTILDNVCLTIEDNDLWLDDYLVFSKNYNIDSLVNSINHRDRNEIGQRITIPRLFVIDSFYVIPDSIILNFGTHSIISNVKYKKSKPFVLSTSDR